MNYRDVTTQYNNILYYYGFKKNKRLIEALSGVSRFKMKNAMKSYDDFRNLKLNEIIKLDEVVTSIANNEKLF